VGEPGQGFEIAMATLDIFRASVGAAALGFARRALDESLARVESREQFGKKLGDFQIVQAKLADMATSVDASALLVYRAAWMKDQGLAATRETSIAKYFAVEAAVRAAGEAVLLHGGRGYSSEYPVERYYRDIKGLQIYEGTAHIQQIVIARDLLGREERLPPGSAGREKGGAP
jgi:alkylation response protein AidB-like acyl-CoA dehydrogenase